MTKKVLKQRLYPTSQRIFYKNVILSIKLKISQFLAKNWLVSKKRNQKIRKIVKKNENIL